MSDKQQRQQLYGWDRSSSLDTASPYPLGVTMASYEKKTSKDDDRPEDSGPQAFSHLKAFVVIFSYLGMLPLSIRSNVPTFQWCSIPTFMTVAVIVCTGALALDAMVYIMITSATTWGIEAIAVRPRFMLYYVMMPVVLVMIINICRRLPAMVVEWDDVTMVIRKPLYRDHSPIHTTQLTIILVTLAFTVLIMIEHVLRELSFGTCVEHGGNTTTTTNVTMTYFECYFDNRYTFSCFETYNEWLSIAIFVVEKFGMLAWSFPSLLIIVLSVSLSANFKVIAKLVESDISREDNRSGRILRTMHDWKTVREDHLALCKLLRHMDKLVSPLTLMTYVINIYWNCVQAYKAVRPKDGGVMEGIYIWISFMLLLVRLGGVSLAGTILYEQANKPLRYLFHCHPRSYCDEVVRFQTHISGQSLGFTGMKFFVVDRSLFLTIFGVILTYELILLDSS